jgi:carbohydrate-selective porin OprB
VSFVGGYLGQPAANPVGGEQEGESSWLSNVSFGAFSDLKRLMDWKGGLFLTDFDWKSGGDGLSANAVGNQFPVQLSSGEDATRLAHLALGQELWNNSAELAAGRIITGEDFATIRLACPSLNQAICANPIAANQSISFPTYPYGVWGARLKVKPGSSWYAQTGADAVYPEFRDADDHGVRFSLPDDAGVLALGEFGMLAFIQTAFKLQSQNNLMRNFQHGVFIQSSHIFFKSLFRNGMNIIDLNKGWLWQVSFLTDIYFCWIALSLGGYFCNGNLVEIVQHILPSKNNNRPVTDSSA